MKVKVIDSIMGSGKSTWSRKYMFENKVDKFVYITPYLKEISSFLGDKKDIDGNVMYSPLYTERKFREPKHLGEGKLEGLHKLLINDYNVATTHALFKLSNQETIDLISSGEYVLILDEALDVFSLEEMRIKDYEMLLNTNKIKVSDKKIIEWLDDEYEGEFSPFKQLCKNGTVVELKRSQKVQLMVWNFNIESFMSFKEIFIMTYLFEASFLKYYFDIHKIEYEKYCIEDGELVRYEDKRSYDKNKYKDLINIYCGNLNTVGDKETALSLSWFKNNISLASKLKNNIYNYLQHIVKAKSSQVLWTSFKSVKKHLSGRGYTKGFVVCNVKASNEYQDKDVLVYCCNRYISPDYLGYFSNHNVTMDEDLFALSEMIQWIWRSAIRKREPGPIQLYVPSSRMRGLLIDWLNDENL